MKPGDHIRVASSAGDLDDAVVLAFRRAAIIGYTLDIGAAHIPATMLAIQDGEGNWWDLAGRSLIMTPASQGETPCNALFTATTQS